MVAWYQEYFGQANDTVAFLRRNFKYRHIQLNENHASNERSQLEYVASLWVP